MYISIPEALIELRVTYGQWVSQRKTLWLDKQNVQSHSPSDDFCHSSGAQSNQSPQGSDDGIRSPGQLSLSLTSVGKNLQNLLRKILRVVSVIHAFTGALWEERGCFIDPELRLACSQQETMGFVLLACIHFTIGMKHKQRCCFCASLLGLTIDISLFKCVLFPIL